jgi:carbamoyl-phosphate synthase large subunit
MSAALPVIVTGTGGGGVGEQIVKALRLGETKYEIVATDVTDLSAGRAMGDQFHLLPRAGALGYVEALLALAEKTDARAVFCGSEPELKVLAGARGKIEAAGLLLPVNPGSVLETCLDKGRTAEFLGSHGFTVPHTLRIAALADLERIEFLPAILKPVSGGGSANVFIAQDRSELELFARYLLGLGAGFIAQQYVGDETSEFTVGVLMSMDGDLINSVAIRREISSGLGSRLRVANRGDGRFGSHLVVSSGISQGHLGRYPQVTAPCEKMALALGCRGAVNFQCRMVDGAPLVFEINPRFSGTTSIRALAGYNEPDVLIRRHVLCEEIAPHFAYRAGHYRRGLAEWLVAEDGAARESGAR